MKFTISPFAGTVGTLTTATGCSTSLKMHLRITRHGSRFHFYLDRISSISGKQKNTSLPQRPCASHFLQFFCQFTTWTKNKSENAEKSIWYVATASNIHCRIGSRTCGVLRTHLLNIGQLFCEHERLCDDILKSRTPSKFIKKNVRYHGCTCRQTSTPTKRRLISTSIVCKVRKRLVSANGASRRIEILV